MSKLFTNKKDEEKSIITLFNVRMTFPSLIEHATNPEGLTTGKYSSTFELDRENHKQEISELKLLISKCAKETFGKSLPADRTCLKDFSIADDEEDENKIILRDKMKLNAGNKERPRLFGKLGETLSLDLAEEQLYNGCYVNIKISLWAFDGKKKKVPDRICANLWAVQFASDGKKIVFNKQENPVGENDFGPIPGAKSDFDDEDVSFS